MPSNPQNCPQCGVAITATQKFCVKCRAKLPAGGVTVPQPGATTMAGVVGGSGVRGGRWSRRPGEVAARIELSNVEGWSSKPLTIEPGTKAILIGDGHLADVVSTGTYDLARHKSYQRMSAVVIDAEDIPVVFSFPGLFTRDNLEIAAECELVMQINDPGAFFTQVVKDDSVVTRQDIADNLRDEMQNAIQTLVAARDFDTLDSSRDSKDDLELDLSSHMRSTLARIGLELVQIRSIEFLQPAVLELRRKESENKIGEVEAGVLEQRAVVRERLMKAENLEQIAGMRTKDELERVRRELDTNRALSDIEWQKMMHIAAENEGDRQLGHEHTLAMLQEQRGQELSILRLQQERDSQGLQQEIEEKRAAFARRQEILDTQAKATKAESGIESLRKLKETSRDDKIARRNAEVDAEIRLIEAKKDLTPEQMLALETSESADAGAALAAKYNAEAAQASGTKSCPECGASCSASAKFCGNCKHKFEG